MPYPYEIRIVGKPGATRTAGTVPGAHRIARRLLRAHPIHVVEIREQATGSLIHIRSSDAEPRVSNRDAFGPFD